MEEVERRRRPKPRPRRHQTDPRSPRAPGGTTATRGHAPRARATATAGSNPLRRRAHRARLPNTLTRRLPGPRDTHPLGPARRPGSGPQRKTVSAPDHITIRARPHRKTPSSGRKSPTTPQLWPESTTFDFTERARTSDTGRLSALYSDPLTELQPPRTRRREQDPVGRKRWNALPGPDDPHQVGRVASAHHHHVTAKRRPASEAWSQSREGVCGTVVDQTPLIFTRNSAPGSRLTTST